MSVYYMDEHRYDDILYLPHHRSSERGYMSLHDRAAQFAPFTTLAGYEELIIETARFTDEKIVLDEYAVEKINETLYEISLNLQKQPEVIVTYFLPDSSKNGGTYHTDIGIVKKIDTIEKIMTMDDGRKIHMEQIIRLETLEES